MSGGESAGRWVDEADLPEALPDAEASRVCTEYWLIVCWQTCPMGDAALTTAWRNGALRHELATNHSAVFDDLTRGLWLSEGEES